MSSRWLLLMFIMMAGGCASLDDCRYDLVQQVQARFAWGEAKRSIPVELNNRDYAKGYRDGYVDVSKGGNGACPPVPPDCYWDRSLQNEEGLMRVRQWYLGYSHGSQDALMSLRNMWHEVPSVERAGVSPTLAWSSEPLMAEYMSTQSNDEPKVESASKGDPVLETDVDVVPYPASSAAEQTSEPALEEVTPIVQPQEPTVQ